MTEWKLPEAFVFDGRTVRNGVSGDGPPLVVVHGTPWSSFKMKTSHKEIKDVKQRRKI
jgi:hypothetical protein